MSDYTGDASSSELDLYAIDGMDFTAAPFASSREERIDRALSFIKRQHNARHDTVPPLKKYSIRKIALHFQVPKSTLHDRARQTAAGVTNGAGSHHATKRKNQAVSGMETCIVSVPNVAASTKCHESQMKLTFEQERALLDQIRTINMAMGNVMSGTQIRELVSGTVEHVSLGKKWVSNYVKRHRNHEVYGTGSTAVTLARYRQYKNNSKLLWNSFVPALSNEISGLAKNSQKFLYAVRCVHDLSHIFACFEICPSSMTADLVSPPVVVANRNPDLIDVSMSILTSYLSCNDTVDTMFFEGFDNAFHWTPKECQDISTLTKFISLPWNQQIITQTVLPIFQDSIDATITNTPQFTAPMPLQLEQTSFDQIAVEIRTHTRLSPPNESSLSYSSPLQNLEDHSQEHIDNSDQLVRPQDNARHSDGLFSLQDQIDSVVTNVQQYENQLLDAVADTDSKAVLLDIFAKVKALKHIVATTTNTHTNTET